MSKIDGKRKNLRVQGSNEEFWISSSNKSSFEDLIDEQRDKTMGIAQEA
jgi:hypothetical protein